MIPRHCQIYFTNKYFGFVNIIGSLGKQECLISVNALARSFKGPVFPHYLSTTLLIES